MSFLLVINQRIVPKKKHFTALLLHFLKIEQLVFYSFLFIAKVVGYQNGTSIQDNNFIAPAFMTVGCNTVDIQDIKIDDGGAGAVGWGAELFSIWEGVPTVVEGSEFVYCDPSYDASGESTSYYWGDASLNKVAYSFAAGQGVVINCAADYTISTSGQVKNDDLVFTSQQDNNFTGNPFGAPIDIQAVVIDDGNTGAIGWGAELFSIWEGVPTVKSGSEYVYCDPSYDASGESETYYWGDSDLNKVTYSIPAGQGFVINCAAGYTITVKVPYTL